MANMINVDNLTYCGEEAAGIFAKDIYNIDLRQYGVTFMDGVKGKVKLYSGEMDEAFQPYTCPFTPNGNVVLDEAFIEPAALKVNQEECYDKFWNTWLVRQTEISLNGGIPQTFSEWFFAELRKKMAKEYQEIFWGGDTARSADTKSYLKVVDGIEKQLHENSAVTKVSGATITVDNAISQVEAVVMKGLEVAATSEVDTEGYKIFMNHNDVRMLEVALGKLCCDVQNNRVFSNYGRENGRIYIMGFEVIPTLQSAGKIIFGPARNLVLGYDTYDSRLEFKLIDMRNTTGDNMFRIIAITNIAVGIVLPSLFVLSE